MNTTQNNFVKDCNIEDTKKFTLDRCAAKDDVIEKGLSKDAFEKLLRRKLLEITIYHNHHILQIHQVQHRLQIQIMKKLIARLIQLNLRDMLTLMKEKTLITKNFSQILINQKDYSKNNQVESYEGNLIYQI